MSLDFRKTYQFGFEYLQVCWYGYSFTHRTVNTNVLKYECIHILSYTHESGMSQHQREMCFRCHFQSIEHHKTLSKNLFPNSQSATVSHWF